jgi:hypothetical protein
LGADLGEVLATAGRITDGDEASWHREWATGARVAELGERSLAAGPKGTDVGDDIAFGSNAHRHGG